MLTTKFFLTKRADGFYYMCIKYLDGRTGWKSTKCRKKIGGLREERNLNTSAMQPT